MIYFTRNLDPTPPTTPLLYPSAIFQGATQLSPLQIRLSVENKNTWQDDEDENSGSGKSKNSDEITGYGRFCHGKSGSNAPSWWAPDKGYFQRSCCLKKTTYCFGQRICLCRNKKIELYIYVLIYRPYCICNQQN